MAAKRKKTTKVLVVEATPPKPILRCTTETIHSVEYHELDTFIEAVTGHHYDCVCNEEWGNDSQHRFYVDGILSDYDQKDWEKFKKTGEEETYSLRNILNGLCKEGHIQKGVYLVAVCW